MKLTAELDKARDILFVRITGTYRRPDDSYEAQRFIIDSHPEYGTKRVLLDLTRAEIVAGTLATLETAESRPELAQELMKYRFAAVYSKIGPDERFYEDAANNRNFSARVFDDFEKAIEWLEE